MTKQEFLAFSLPYGLKVYDCIGNSIEAVDYSKGCPKCVCEAIGQVKNENKCVNVFQAAYDKQLKPILHPPSDLTKEIENNGEKLVLIEKLLGKFEDGFSILLNDSWGIQVRDNRTQKVSTITFSNLSLNQAIKLISYHFDIAGLIEKGEAIDVNTLTENPYK